MSLPVYGITLIKMKSCDTGIAYRIFKTHATVLQSSTEPRNSISRARSVRIFGEFLPPRSGTTSRIRIQGKKVPIRIPQNDKDPCIRIRHTDF